MWVIPEAIVSTCRILRYIQVYTAAKEEVSKALLWALLNLMFVYSLALEAKLGL